MVADGSGTRRPDLLEFKEFSRSLAWPADCTKLGVITKLSRKGTSTMNSYSRLIRSKVARTATVAGLSVFVLLAGISPAFAQDNGKHKGWYKNGKASEKAARKANKAARLGNGGVVVGDTIRNDRNGTVIDRSQTRARRNTRTYRDSNGNRVYDYRGTRVDPYAQYPQYRRQGTYPYNNSNGNYPYYGNGSQPYYDNREGDLDRDEVAERAAQNGYYAGFQRGQYDASRRNRSNPYGHGAYTFGYDGFDPSWGSASTYQQYYRQYFTQGYQDGYGQRGYNRQYNRRF
jgi:hypothetical protein